MQKRQFEKGGWLADMSGYMKDPNLTAPDLVESDFSTAGLQYAKNDKGRMLSLPWSVDYFILYYNKEMFQKKGIVVPKTFDEMVAAAEKLTDPKEGTFGFVGRGLRNANMTLWTNFFLNCGGEFLDSKGGILTDGPEAIEATKFYQTLLTKVAPPGVAGFNWMGIDGVLHARTFGDVDRRRRLGAAAGRPGRLAHRRQGRLHPRSGRTQGTIFGDLWRRSRHRSRKQGQGSRLSALPVGGLEGRRALRRCRPAAACRSEIPSWAIPKFKKGSRTGNGCSR